MQSTVLGEIQRPGQIRRAPAIQARMDRAAQTGPRPACLRSHWANPCRRAGRGSSPEVADLWGPSLPKSLEALARFGLFCHDSDSFRRFLLFEERLHLNHTHLFTLVA